MYADPSKIRSKVVKVYLNDNEHALIDAFVNYTGQQKAPMVRELLLEAAQRVLFGEDGAVARPAVEGALSVHKMPF